MSETKTMPIFLLDLVPLPGEPVPLLIFEERYKQMVADCLSLKYGKKEFGISYLQDKTLHQVGCSVSIEEVLKEYDDGRMDIMTVGRRRYRIIETLEEEAYLTATVEIVEDRETSDGSETLRKEINGFLERFLGVLGPKMALQLDDFDNAFQIAHLLNLEKSTKLKLLGSSHEDERLQILTAYLEEFVPKLEYAQEFNRRVRSNGHF